MTCQPYNPAAGASAGTRRPARRPDRRPALSVLALLLATLVAAPAPAQVFGPPVHVRPLYVGPVGIRHVGPVGIRPVTNPAGRLPIGRPQPCRVVPTIIGPQLAPSAAGVPSAIEPQPVITSYPPALPVDAAPLLEQLSGAVRIVIDEALLNRLLARSETDAGPVVDNILGADVTGNQNTSTTLTVDVLACGQRARLQLSLCGTTLNQTIGVTPQATVRSRGRHAFRITKQVDFDGLSFSTRSPAAWVTPQLTNEGAATPLTGVPLIGPLSSQIALNEAQRRRPAVEQVVTRRVTDQVAPRFNQEVDQQLSDANVRLQQHVVSLLGAAGLTPGDVSVRSTDQHVLFGLRVPYVQTRRRPILPPFAAPIQTPDQNEPRSNASTQNESIPNEPGQDEQNPNKPDPNRPAPTGPNPDGPDPDRPDPDEPRSDTQPVQLKLPDPQPTSVQPSVRQPILLAPIEPLDDDVPADPPPVEDPAPSEASAAQEGEFTVIRRISDTQSQPANEPAPAQQTPPAELPSLTIERESPRVAPVRSTPSLAGPASVQPVGNGSPPPVESPSPMEPPPSFTAGESLTLAIHEAAINYALQRAPLEGARVPDRTIDRLLEQLREFLEGTPPAELSLEVPGGEQPEFATLVLGSEAPLSVRFQQGQLLIEAVAAFEPKLTPAVPAQHVQIPFTLRSQEGRVTLAPGDVSVTALPGSVDTPLSELARPIIRQQIMQRLQPVEIPTSLPLSLPGLPSIELTTREVQLADGWLLIAID